EVVHEWRTSRRDLAATSPGDTSIRPLGDVRIVDMTWVWAGPFATMQLAYLGAEVIKIESPTRIDLVRRLGPYAGGITGTNRSGYFNQYNQGKQSIALDLATVADRQLLDGLIAKSDLIVDNMRSGALARMGYDDARLHTINPRLIATAISGFGESGPDRDRAAYGAIINSLSGVAEITGPVGGGPVDLQLSLADPCSGLHAAIGMLAALYRQRVTGRGGRADCAMVEAWIAACPWGVLAASSGETPEAVGNRDAVLCPNGVFPCAGVDEWVALAVDGDEQFTALADVLGLPELAAHPRFATVEARRADEGALEELIASWTITRTPAEVVALLSSRGLPAARVDRMDDVLASAQLADRRFFTELDHPEVGPLRLAGPPYRASRSPIGPTRPAPQLGQHTDEVLHRILGIDPAERPTS
ncbi:MAG: L-carnitine dehydratase/bile acid-inducible protein, partial [Ilumatobacteraceae bacterium]|nr:L-carnitine dehydratase/bile acid-inducible protein [Ilumatobacteraceae bacterium]